MGFNTVGVCDELNQQLADVQGALASKPRDVVALRWSWREPWPSLFSRFLKCQIMPIANRAGRFPVQLDSTCTAPPCYSSISALAPPLAQPVCAPRCLTLAKVASNDGEMGEGQGKGLL